MVKFFGYSKCLEGLTCMYQGPETGEKEYGPLTNVGPSLHSENHINIFNTFFLPFTKIILKLYNGNDLQYFTVQTNIHERP
jgi:hypothetical protein